MRLLLSNYKHVETKIEWNHGANSNQLYRPEGSLTGGKASPADSLHGELRVPMGWEGSAEKTLTSLYGSTASEMTLGG
jgi:hypothetical protein